MLLFSRILACSFFENKLRLHQIGHAQAGPRGLVAVGRPDAALGRADFGAAFAQLALLVEHAVIGQNQMRAIADEQILADRDADLSQAFDFGDERDRIDDHAVADDANFAAPQNAGRNQMQDVLGPAMDDGVARRCSRPGCARRRPPSRSERR